MVRETKRVMVGSFPSKPNSQLNLEQVRARPPQG